MSAVNRSQEQTHSIAFNGKKLTWKVASLWKLSEHLKPFDFPIDDFSGFDRDCWFGDRYEPTVNKILEHCLKINDADLDFPIILSENGTVMDGIHRICKARLEGLATIKAVKFSKNPPPDMIEDL